MTDTFRNLDVGMTGPAEKHFMLSIDTDNDVDPRPRAIRCLNAGTITLRDVDGVDIPYPQLAGDVITFRGVRVMAMTGTFVAWL